jgi:hypothetical protein
MVRLVFGRLRVDCREEGLCELQLAHVCFFCFCLFSQAYERLAKSKRCQDDGLWKRRSECGGKVGRSGSHVGRGLGRGEERFRAN